MRTKFCAFRVLKRIIFGHIFIAIENLSANEKRLLFSRRQRRQGVYLVWIVPKAFDHTKPPCRVCTRRRCERPVSVVPRAADRKHRKMHYHLINLLAIPTIDFFFSLSALASASRSKSFFIFYFRLEFVSSIRNLCAMHYEFFHRKNTN